MSSHHNTTNVSQNDPVAEGESSQMPRGFGISKHARRQQQKGTKSKAKAASAESPTGPAKATDVANPANDPEPLPKINGKEVDTSKPQWELKLTISELKEFRAQQATMNHNKLHRSHPIDLPKPEEKTGTSQGQSNSKVSKAVASHRRANTEVNGGTASAPRIGSNVRSGKPPVAPCGIIGCPVIAQHESKVCEFNEPCRPNFIKMIQAKGKKATASEWTKVDQFFNLHRFESTQAKKKAKVEARN